MKQLVIGALLVICLACGGADLESHAGVTEAAIGHMEKLADILEGIDSKEAADAAADDLEELATEMAEIVQRSRSWASPTRKRPSGSARSTSRA
ncbi:MAG: hypothetical protein ACYTHK_15570 [Planctomycetota bacterium]|jgi:hypothetical protein